MRKYKCVLKLLFSILFISFGFEIRAQTDEIKKREFAIKQKLQFEDWPENNNQKRNGVNLSNHFIKELDNSKEARPNKKFFIAKTKNDSSFIQYCSKWIQSDSSFVEITMSYLESPSEAQNYVMDYYILGSSLPFEILSYSRDMPVKVGDISFWNGLLFIRDNVVVKLYLEGEFFKKSLNLAKEIDSLLLSQSVSIGTNNYKPNASKDEKGNLIIIEP